MSIDETISAEELKGKLTNLAIYMPEERPKVHAVASYLASRLGDSELSPKGFVEAFQLMFLDMQRGIDGYTGNPLPEELRDPLGIAYFTASRKVPAIAEAICSKEFAGLVRQEANRTMRPLARFDASEDRASLTCYREPWELPIRDNPGYSSPAFGVRPAKKDPVNK